MPNWKRGSELSHAAQRQALAQFVHRYTGENMPPWAHHGPGGFPYPVQFKDDAEWLANTDFAVTQAGELDKRVTHCFGQPTWPEGNPDEQEIARRVEAAADLAYDIYKEMEEDS